MTKGFHGHCSRAAADAAKLMVCAIAAGLLVASACFPSLNKIHLGACINECNGRAKECLGDGAGGSPSCPAAESCFDEVQKCSDEATACGDNCDGCKELGECLSEDSCRSECAHMANACGKRIRGCVDEVQECARGEVEDGKRCLTDLVACVATCASEAEAVIKGSK
jgi:hypothetical protein